MPKRPCELSYRPVLQHHQAAESAALPAVIRRKEQTNPEHDQQGWDMNGQGNYQRRRSSRSKPHNAQGELMLTLGTS